MPIMWGLEWYLHIGWLKTIRVTHYCEMQMTNIVSDQLPDEVNTVSATQTLRISYCDQRKIQLLLFLLRLFKEAEGCSG